MLRIKQIIIKVIHMVKVRGAGRLAFSGGLVLLVWCLWYHCCTAPAFVPKNLRRYLRFPEGYTVQEKQLSDEDLNKLRLKVEKLNNDAEVYNWAKPNEGTIRQDTPIIAIQVHKDAERLQFLIISLGQVHYIQRVLLVFSHSYYDEEMNKLIRSIQFCKFMQIFYPHSLQLHPHSFPGADPDDCNGAPAEPRGRCNEREARRTQHKQHWWWKAHFIFEGMEMPSKKRVVVFLEEDDYVLPDMMYMLRYVRRAMDYFPSAQVAALGRAPAAGLEYDALLVDTWTPQHARGLVLNGSAWRRAAALADRFCLYDDCGWSYSLAHLFQGFPRGPVDVAACMAPRVLPTRFLSTNARTAARMAHAIGARAALFPAAPRAVVAVSGAGRVRRAWRPPRGAGGWADLRDQLLCLEARATTTAEPTGTGDLTPPGLANASGL